MKSLTRNKSRNNLKKIVIQTLLMYKNGSKKIKKISKHYQINQFPVLLNYQIKKSVN